ncbi:hypothetical protein FS749_000826 [Ceratobasidium sp. UAMH 11750]|nr:hypothetical protein FS749_000826 [Ceratobasidium sp. UAMH 11750]
MSSDRASTISSANTPAMEWTQLDGEMSIREARVKMKDLSTRVDRAGRHIIPRAISGFSFRKGLEFFTLKPGMTDKDWRGVKLVGYVASLSWEERRPIVATGWWELEDYVVGCRLMELEPHHIYTDVNPCFRPGQRTAWADTYDHGYALLHPAPGYLSRWIEFLESWRPNGRSLKQFEDFKSLDPNPPWWPPAQLDILPRIRELIAKEEGQVHGDSDAPSSVAGASVPDAALPATADSPNPGEPGTTALHISPGPNQPLNLFSEPTAAQDPDVPDIPNELDMFDVINMPDSPADDIPKSPNLSVVPVISVDPEGRVAPIAPIAPVALSSPGSPGSPVAPVAPVAPEHPVVRIAVITPDDPKIPVVRDLPVMAQTPAPTDIAIPAQPQLESMATGSVAGQKCPLDDPEPNARANPTFSSSPHHQCGDSTVLQLLPRVLPTDLESTSVGPTINLREELVHTGSSIGVYGGAYVFLVSQWGDRHSSELYRNEGFWKLWNDLRALGTAQQILLPSLPHALLAKLPMLTVLQLYATAAFLEEEVRGPVQKRLVARVAMLAQQGQLNPEHMEVWVKISQVICEWKDAFGSRSSDIPLPDFTPCFA